MFLFLLIEGVTLQPESSWSWLFEGTFQIGTIFDHPVYLKHSTHEGKPCIACAIDDEHSPERYVGEKRAEMVLVLKYYEDAMRFRNHRQDLARIIEGISLCYQNMSLFASLAP